MATGAVGYALFEKNRLVHVSDGTPIAYAELGHGHRIPVVLANGWSCSDAYWVAIGPTGEDITNDGGIHWKHTDSLNLNAVAVLDSGTGWAVGPRGTIARLVNHFKNFRTGFLAAESDALGSIHHPASPSTYGTLESTVRASNSNSRLTNNAF